jgi:TRAP-type C4-dicarboxylate transport system permease small subunit
MLVLAETCILFAGVVSRYVFNSPIIWTDELATFLFLWLAMIGAAVALRRDGHMRLTTFVSWVGPQWGSWLATLASLVLIVFVLEILVPAQPLSRDAEARHASGEMTGIARVMVTFLAALVGHVRGGLAYVLLGAMYLVSGISGSKAADMAAVAPIREGGNAEGEGDRHADEDARGDNDNKEQYQAGTAHFRQQRLRQPQPAGDPADQRERQQKRHPGRCFQQAQQGDRRDQSSADQDRDYPIPVRDMQGDQLGRALNV